jgi:DNA-binding MarR family transcriptional regulator
MVDETDTLYGETIRNFLTLYRHLRRYGREMQQEGISGRKVSALRYLIEAGPLAIGQLSAYLCVSDSSTSEMVAWLEERGHVTRNRWAEDNRVVLVEVTPSGRGLVARTSLGGIPRLREAIKSLPGERLGVVNDAMATLIELLEIENGC